jgi:hypothetical protein
MPTLPIVIVIVGMVMLPSRVAAPLAACRARGAVVVVAVGVRGRGVGALVGGIVDGGFGGVVDTADCVVVRYYSRATGGSAGGRDVLTFTAFLAQAFVVNHILCPLYPPLAPLPGTPHCPTQP